MSHDEPRWEWRRFGEGFGPVAEAELPGPPPERVQESDEVYVLSFAGGDTVKVRDELLDVKHLVAVNEDGLEQWNPVLKAPFPLGRDDLERVLAGLRVEAALERGEYTLDQLLGEVLATTPGVLSVEVHKTRRRYTIGGCTSELTDVRTEHGSTRTIAVESTDPEQVSAAVRALGLDTRPNEAYPRGLLAFLRVGRYAVVDVGTNSVKFHIGERGQDGGWRTVVDRSAVTRLGEGLRETGSLGPEPMARTADAIADMAAEADREGVVAVAAVGTAGMRSAGNSHELVDTVRERTGISIDVISGEDEARLAYVAATAELDVGTGASVVFDSGGGSSQFTFGHGDSIDEQFSVDVGAVRFTERFGLAGAVSEEELQAALDAIAGDLSRLDDHASPDAVIGIGGSVTNITAVMHELAEYDSEVVQGSVVGRDELDRQIDLYRTRSADERREIVGLQPERAEVILAGACIVRTIVTKLGSDTFTASDRGLRHGVLIDRFG